MGSDTRVAVVGGGVLGVSSAYFLARRGASVVLLERERLGAGASFGNAGTVSAGHPPLNKPGRIVQALSQMLDPTSPLYVKPRWDPSLWRWLLGFARHCTEDHVEAAMRVMAPLGKEALRYFEELVEGEGIACGYATDGYYAVCRTREGVKEVREEAEVIRAYGYEPDVLDAAALRDVEPALGAVSGGVFYPEAATLHPWEFLAGLADRARALGVDVREGEGVVAVVEEGGRARGVRLEDGSTVEADAVVLATGPFSLELASALGTRLPVQPGKGYHRDVVVGPHGAPRLRIACVLHESSVFCTPMDGFVRFAGTMEFSGLNDDLRPARLEQLTRSARAYFPALGAAPPRSEWCGLRPVSVDGLPIVGPLPDVPNVVIATGHGMLGLTLGPVSGGLVADWILGDGPEPLYRELAPARFG